MTDLDEIIPPALNLFRVPPKQCAVERIQWLDYRPVANLDTGLPIQFNISSAGQAFIDLSRTFLYVKVRVVKKGKPLTDDKFVGPVNLWCHSLFRDCSITLQQTPVLNTGRLYAYKSYIETMLTNGPGDLPRLATEMFYKDTFMAGTHENKDDPSQINAGYIMRNRRVLNGQWCEMYGVLHHDLCQTKRLLPCGVEIGVKLTPNPPAFHLRSDAAYASIYDIEYQEISLKVCHVTLRPEVFMAIDKVMSSGVTAKLPVNKTEINSYIMTRGVTSWSQNDLFQNRVPSKLVICLVKSSNMAGEFASNPYEFRDFNLNTITITKDGQVTPFKPIKTNFATGECIEAYRNLYSHDKDQRFITFNDFTKGNAFFVYRLDDQLYNNECASYKRHGNISIELNFNQPLMDNVNVVVYAQFDALIEIDQYRNIKQ